VPAEGSAHRTHAAGTTCDCTHLAPESVPLALADLHRSLALHSRVAVHASALTWPTQRLDDVVIGAGFEVDTIDVSPGSNDMAPGSDPPLLTVGARRAESLPDTVGADMRLLISGLNPSPAATDAGVGFFRPGNRFWPATIAAGLATRDRDPLDALHRHGVGMTDLVKRTTRRADELSADEYRAGVARLDRMCEWLQPEAVCLVGLAGWRAAVDRRAVAGWQERRLGGRPVYVMPSTSGLNAATTKDELVDHLRAAASAAPAVGGQADRRPT